MSILGDERRLQQAKHNLHRLARDNARTPVPWTDVPNAGFCPPTTTPWMKVNDDYKKYNVRTELANTDGLSVLQFWRYALARRKNFKESLVYGSFECLDEAHETIFAYKRAGVTGEAWVVGFEFFGEGSRVDDSRWARFTWIRGGQLW